MIKFWKSAAKGKTGCPVRPPELNCVNNSNRIVLDTQLEDEHEDHSHIFEKKSKLSLNLHNILIERKSVKYFIQFMDAIGKHLLIKCWLELENFQNLVSNTNTNNEVDHHSKISRAKSFDLHSNANKDNHEEFKLHRFSWKENSDSFSTTSKTMQNKNDCSTSSCGNLAEHARFLENYNNTQLTEEAIDLFKKYVALEAPHQLDLSDSVRKTVISNICQPEGQIKEDCFKPVQDVLFTHMEKKHFDNFQNSPFFIKAQIDMLTSGSLNLQDILFNEAILFYFTEFLEQESCSLLLEFLMAVMNFRDNLISNNNSNLEQAEADAVVLYDKYVSLQATNPVGFSTDIRLKIESDICREGGPLPTCFDLPYRIVFKTLKRYVKSFFESELYYKYLSEMINAVDQIWNSNHKSHSDCSSDFSISTQNTLLAMGDPVFRKKKRNHSVPDMTIDSNQLYNADALWQRKRHEGLSLGRVNSLGRFESKFEPDPDKKDKSVLKKMVSRFVPTNTAKVEEEMAWQIAHMIVKDVTDLTMAPPDTERDDV